MQVCYRDAQATSPPGLVPPYAVTLPVDTWTWTWHRWFSGARYEPGVHVSISGAYLDPDGW